MANAAGPRITVIGDSIMVGVAPYLKKKYPDIVVDAKIGRQMSEASFVINNLKRNKKLGNIIVIELGTNGPFTRKQLFSVVKSFGKQRKILLVNSKVPRPWEQTVNSTLLEAANTFPNVSLVNWHDESIGNDSYFNPDGVHPNQKGSEVYASLIEASLDIKKQ